MLDVNVGFNTHLYNLKNDLVNTINNSGLPVGVAYYIVKDLFMDIQNAYESTLKKEQEAALKNIQETNSDNEPKKTKVITKKVEK